jgi:hypothetical protein
MRNLICRDSVPWLAAARDVGAIITALPDAAEMELKTEQWLQWFPEAVGACMLAASEEAPSIFYQTDHKSASGIFSVAALLFAAAERANVRCLWHKIVLRGAPGTLDPFRPGYTHLVAFSALGTAGTATPDVIERGDLLYQSAMSLHAAQVALDFAARTTDQIVDPFCGRGTVVALADAMGLHATGLDIDPKQIEYAERLKVPCRPEFMYV